MEPAQAGAAFGFTLSLPGILSNIANKVLLDGYNYQEAAWRSICRIGSLRDLRVPAGALGDFFGPGTTVGIPFAAQLGMRLSF